MSKQRGAPAVTMPLAGQKAEGQLSSVTASPTASWRDRKRLPDDGADVAIPLAAPGYAWSGPPAAKVARRDAGPSSSMFGGGPSSLQPGSLSSVAAANSAADHAASGPAFPPPASASWAPLPAGSSGANLRKHARMDDVVFEDEGDKWPASISPTTAEAQSTLFHVREDGVAFPAFDSRAAVSAVPMASMGRAAKVRRVAPESVLTPFAEAKSSDRLSSSTEGMSVEPALQADNMALVPFRRGPTPSEPWSNALKSLSVIPATFATVTPGFGAVPVEPSDPFREQQMQLVLYQAPRLMPTGTVPSPEDETTPGSPAAMLDNSASRVSLTMDAEPLESASMEL